jgi:hypothetical protein
MTWNISRSTTIALLLSPVGILLISITRLLIVSNYNVETALTVASSAGYVNTLVGSLIPVVPVFMPFLGLALLFLNRFILGMLAFFAVVFSSPTAITRSQAVRIVEHDGRLLAHSSAILALGVAVLVVVSFGVMFTRTEDIRITLSTILGIALVPFVLLLYPLPTQGTFYAQQLQEPWLPAEDFTLTSHTEIVGYLLSRSDGWFVILSAPDRSIAYVHADDVASQQVCQIGAASRGRPLVAVIKSPAVVPYCSLPSPTPHSLRVAHEQY